MKELIAAMVIAFLMCAFIEWDILASRWAWFTRLGYCVVVVLLIVAWMKPDATTGGGRAQKK